jgi:hypothetical protein
MTWTKLGDEYGDQAWKLSDAAFRLHTEALVWSNRRHLDGRLDKDEMRLWAKRPEAAELLVTEGWWTDEGDYFQIVYHLGWQRTAAQWLHQSEVNKANQAKRKARRGGSPNNGSLNDSFNERDGTGLDGTGNQAEHSGTAGSRSPYDVGPGAT